MEYFTYIIQSLKDDSYYFGYTTDLCKRIIYHNAGLSKYTRKKKPWRLVYYKKFESKSDAILFEKKLKKYKSHNLIQSFINKNS